MEENKDIQEVKEVKTELTGKAKGWANLELGKFKKGVVSNPNGRPKGSKNKSTIARKWLEITEKSVNEITGCEEFLSQEDLMTLAMIKRAKKGDVKAYKELMNSAFGEEKNINHSGTLGLANITGMEVH
jgi:hypothetical protein